MADRSSTVNQRLVNGLLVAAPFLIAAVALFLGGSALEQDPVEQVPVLDVTAAGPRFTTIDELATASEMIVVAEVSAETTGRAITDPADPRAGVLTTVFTLLVIDSIAPVRNWSDQREYEITLEYETALLDGTPITINGISPPSVGERGLFFLIGGHPPEFPHYGLVNDQGRYPLDGDRTLVALSGDPVVTAVASRSLDQVREQLIG